MEALNPQTPEEIRRDLLEAWNPRGAGSTVGTEYERLIILPLANRMALVKVNKIASALLLEEWQAARSLINGLSQAEARLCALRGSVLAAKTIRDAKAEGTDAAFDGEVDLRWRAATLRLSDEAGVAMDYSPNGFHEGVDRLLDHCPDLASGNVVILDMISRLLAPLSVDAGRGLPSRARRFSSALCWYRTSGRGVNWPGNSWRWSSPSRTATSSPAATDISEAPLNLEPS